MSEFVILKTVKRPQATVTYAEKAWVPGEAIQSQVTAANLPFAPESTQEGTVTGSPAYDVDHFNWVVRALSVGEPPAGDKIQPWQLNDLREGAGLPRGPEIPRSYYWDFNPF